MSKSASEKYFYNILFNQNAARARPQRTEPAPQPVTQQAAGPGEDRDERKPESVVSHLFTQKNSELNQRVATLEAALTDAQAERQALKMQTDTVYGLLAELQSLRAQLADQSAHGGRHGWTAANDRRARDETVATVRLRQTWNRWDKSLMMVALMAVTSALTAAVVQLLPTLSHLSVVMK